MKKNQTAFFKLCLADSIIKLLKTEELDEIHVSDICREAGIGRTTFYRYFNSRNSKEELLVFKITYEWERYAEGYREAVERDKGFALACFIYENKRIFSLLYRRGLIDAIMRAFEELIPADTACDKDASYLMSFFAYGYFGIIYQWIKYDFDETPEQVRGHINRTFSAGLVL